MKGTLVLLLSSFWFLAFGQSIDNIELRGQYSFNDSVRIVETYKNSEDAVDHMYQAMTAIWAVDHASEKSPKSQRIENWSESEHFMMWLGEPTNVGKAHRKIKRIHAKYKKQIIFEVVKEDEGRCGRFVSAWAVPFGKVRIRLCRNFVNFGPQNQSKTVIHELGHEAGLLFDRGVYRCSSARSVASNSQKNRATRRPENYAWLAMAYLGVECSSNSFRSPKGIN